MIGYIGRDLNPKAQYCGAGDILVSFGKLCLSYGRENRIQRIWNPPPTGNSFMLCGNGFERGINIISTHVAEVEKVGVFGNEIDIISNEGIQDITAIAVSPCGRFVLVGSRGEQALPLSLTAF
jgi:hypothetical protein